MSDESREIAVPSPRGALVPQWWADAYGPTTMYITSLDPKKPQDRAKLLAALNEDSPGKEEYVNRDLEMVDVLLMPASKEVDGEISEFVRTVIFLADGTRVAFGSQGIVKSLMLIQQLDRPAPWNPPLVKRLVVRTLGSGRQWPCLIDPPAKPAKK